MVLDTVDDVADNYLGFDEVIVDTEALGTLFVAFLTEGSQHDNLEVGCFVGVAQYIEHVEATDFGHHGVEQHQVGTVLFGSRQGVFAVGDTLDVKAFALQTHQIHIREGIIVFDEQDFLAVCVFCHTDYATCLGLLLQQTRNEPPEHRVSTIRAAFELRMILAGQEERVINPLDDLYQTVVRVNTAGANAPLLVLRHIFDSGFVTVAVALLYVLLAVKLCRQAAGLKVTGVVAQTHRAASVFQPLLARHSIDNRVPGSRVDLSSVGAVQAA